MAKKLSPCEHCQGKKQCTRSGGKSCSVCLRAAGRGPREWGTVRCSFCGGLGHVWVEVEEEKKEAAEEAGDKA